MKNLRNLALLFVSLTLILSSGCSPSRATAPSVTDVPPNSALATDVPESDEEDMAQITDDPVTPPEIHYPSMGSIAFDVDSNATVTAEFLPGHETTLELTDAAGLVWTLTVPMNALAAPQQFTMTALSNLHSQDLPGGLISGLRLEPDGLEFLTPAVLSVSADGAAGLPFLLTGQDDGTGVEIAYMEDAPGVASILHFSTFFFSRMEEEKAIEEMYKKLDDSEKALIQEAKELLKNKDIPVPTPPSIPLECSSEARAKEYAKRVEDFSQAVYKPEGELIDRLLSVKRGKELLSKNTDLSFTLENRLMARVAQKVRLLINTYHGQEEKLDAVSTVALKVARGAALLNTTAPNESDSLFLEELSSWSALLIDQMLEDIRTEHDYRKVSAVWKMAYWAGLLGSSGQSVEEIQAKLERVFQFLMKLKWEMGIVGESRYEAQGEFPLRYLANKAPWGTLIGSGSARMTLAEFENDEDWFVESEPFHVEAIITGFDVCESTTFLTINRFYPTVENHFTLDSDGEVMEIGSMTLMQISWETLYEDRKKTGYSWFAAGETSDQYTFQLNLRDKDVTAVYDIIETVDDQPGGTLEGWFSVELTHTPK